MNLAQQQTDGGGKGRPFRSRAATMRSITSDAWDALESAAVSQGYRLAPAGAPDQKELVHPVLPEPLWVSPNLALTSYRWEYPLGPFPADGGQVGEMARMSGFLRLATVALAGGRLVLRAETPMTDEQVLAANVELLIADLKAGCTLYELCCSGGASGPGPKKPPGLRSRARHIPPGTRQTIESWLREAATLVWQSIPQSDGWHLVRVPGAPADRPPVCTMDLGTELTVGSAVRLGNVAHAEVRRALGLFMLRQSARYWLRVWLDGDAEPPKARIEIALPLGGIHGAQIAAAVSAVGGAYGGMRRELEALCDADDLARTFLELADRRLDGDRTVWSKERTNRR